MDDSAKAALRFVASQLVFVAAMLHIGIGAMEWVRRLRRGVLVPYQGRYLLFVLAGVAVIAGMALAWQSDRDRSWYLAGFATMVGFVVVYFAYHLGGHRRFVFVGEQLAPPEPLSVQFFVDHYVATAFSTITLTVEVLAAALLAVLYVVSGE